MENLPIEIIADIFCVFLPMVSRLQCRHVCKTWLNLLPKPKKGLLYGVSHWKQGYVYEAEFYFSEQKNHDEEQQLSCPVKKLEPSFIISSYTTSHNFMIVGSCKGLVCYAGDSSLTTLERKIYVCNPVTGELIQAPVDKWSGYANPEWGIGFGYDRSSNKYKVVRILLDCNDHYPNGTIQVYTLQGGAVWRSKSSVINGQHVILCRSSYSPSVGVFIGGALYWINQHTMTVVAFDLEHETFKLLPLMPSDGRDADNHVRLMELGGNLCVLEVVPSKQFTVWEYTHDVSLWVTKFNIACEDYRWFEKYALTKSDDEKCLLWHNAVLSCYDPETRTLRKLDETLKKFMDECKPSAFTTTRATPHVNSLVPLKAMMENKRLKAKKSY